MTEQHTRGQQVVAQMQESIGYSPDEEGSVDALIAYKDALEDRLLAVLDRPGLTVTLATNHEATNHDAGLAEVLRRVANCLAEGEVSGNIYDDTGDDLLGSFDLTYHDPRGQRASDLGTRGDVSDPRGGEPR